MFLNLNVKLAGKFDHWLAQRLLVCIRNKGVKSVQGNLTKDGNIVLAVDLARLLARSLSRIQM